MSVKVALARLHPSKKVLGQDSRPLLLGGVSCYLPPDIRHLRIRGDATDKAEVKPLQGGDPLLRGHQG